MYKQKLFGFFCLLQGYLRMWPQQHIIDLSENNLHETIQLHYLHIFFLRLRNDIQFLIDIVSTTISTRLRSFFAVQRGDLANEVVSDAFNQTIEKWAESFEFIVFSYCSKFCQLHIFFNKQPHFRVKPRVAIKIPKMRLKVAMKLLSIFGIEAQGC